MNTLINKDPNAAFRGCKCWTHRVSTGTTGDADIISRSVCWMSSRGCVSSTAGFFSLEISHDRSLCALPSELHITVIMMLLGRLEEDGSACLYTSAAPEETRRRRDDVE